WLAHGARPYESPDGFRDYHAGCDRSKGKPWRAFPRRLSRQGSEVGRHEHFGPQGFRRAAGSDSSANHTASARARTDHQGERLMSTATFRIWRGDKSGGGFQDYKTETSPGMVVLDAVHQIQAESAADLSVRWNCKAGKCGSCSAEINGNP